MNNLFVFGDSFSAGHGVRYTPYLEMIGSDKSADDIAFIERIAKELNLNLVNYAKGGISNSAILKSFYENYHSIQSGDVVLIQSTFWNRLTFTHRDTQKEYHSTGPNSIDERLKDEHYKKICDEYIVLYHSREISMIDTFIVYPLIVDLCKAKGAKILFWSLDEISDECYNRFESLIKDKFLIPPVAEKYVSWFSPMVYENKLRIMDEVQLNDLHLSVKGNDIFFNEMIKQINEK